MEKTNLKRFIFLAIIAFAITMAFAHVLLGLDNTVFRKEHYTVKLHISDKKNRNSYDRRLYVKDIRIDGEPIDLSACSSDQWKWYDEYQYMIFEGADEDFVIYDSSDPIDNFEIDYFAMHAGGIVEYYVNGKLIKREDTYFASDTEWESRNQYFHFFDIKRDSLTLICDFIGIFVITCGFAACIDMFSKHSTPKAHVSLGTFNVLKGIGIILVVLIHSAGVVGFEADKISKNAILILFIIVRYGVMPMFFIISGYGFRKENIGGCIKKQFIYLLKPYIILAVFTSVFVVVKTFLSGLPLKEALSNVLSFPLMITEEHMLFGINVDTMGPAWFILALCFAWIILNLIMQVNRKEIRFGLVLGSLLIAYICYRFDFRYTIFSVTMLTIPYLYLGLVIKQKKLISKEYVYKPLLIMAMSIIAIALSILNGNEIRIDITFMGKYFFLGFMLSAFWGYILIYIFCIIPNLNNSKLAIFGKLGIRTFEILCIHTFWYFIFPWKELSKYFTDIYFLNVLVVFSIHWILIAITYLLKKKTWDRVFSKRYIRKKGV